MQESVCSLVHGKPGESKKQEFRTNPLDKTGHPASKRKMHELKESRIAAEGKHHNGSQEVEGDHNCQDPEPSSSGPRGATQRKALYKMFSGFYVSIITVPKLKI